jgi:hypothetical protein
VSASRAPLPSDVPTFVREVLAYCSAIRSIWVISAPAFATRRRISCAHWSLMAFADLPTLALLRGGAHFHRPDVLLRVVTDHEHFERAWGSPQESGSLFAWGWRRSGASEAFYDEAVWDEPVQHDLVRRIRRRALRLWEAAAPDHNARYRTDLV